MTNNITREDIAEFINQEFGLTKKDCGELVKEIIEEISLIPEWKELMVKLNAE